MRANRRGAAAIAVAIVATGWVVGAAPAQADTAGPSVTSIVPTTTHLTCRGAFEVGFFIECRVVVSSDVFAAGEPTGQITLGGDDAGAFAPGSCTLYNGMCDLSLKAGHGSGGEHQLSAAYSGDATHSGSVGQRRYAFARRSATTRFSCADGPASAQMTCAVTVDDEGKSLVYPTTGSVVLDPGRAGASPQSCTLDANSGCTIIFSFENDRAGASEAVATYSGDTDHDSSSTISTIDLVGSESVTGVGCFSSSGTGAVGDRVRCFVSTSDSRTGAVIDNGTVVFSSPSQSLNGASCVIDVFGGCFVDFTTQPEDIGPLDVRADYNGGVDHLPSAGTTTIAVRELTWIVAKPAIANLVSPTKVNLTMSATLTDALDHTPLPGQTVQFRVDETTLCTGVTDASGVATCSGLTEVVQAARTYTAYYAGDTYKLPAQATGPGVRI